MLFIFVSIGVFVVEISLVNERVVCIAFVFHIPVDFQIPVRYVKASDPAISGTDHSCKGTDDLLTAALASGSSGCGPVGLVSVSSSPPPSHGRPSSVLALAGNYLSLPSPRAVIAWTPATLNPAREQV